MQPNTKKLTAAQVLEEPGVYSFIASAEGKPMMEVFNAVKVAYPNLQGSLLDLRKAFKAKMATAPAADEPGFSLPTPDVRELRTPVVEKVTTVGTPPAAFSIPITQWTVLDMAQAKEFFAGVSSKMEAANEAFAAVIKPGAPPPVAFVSPPKAEVASARAPDKRRLMQKFGEYLAAHPGKGSREIAEAIGTTHKNVMNLRSRWNQRAKANGKPLVGDASNGRGYSFLGAMTPSQAAPSLDEVLGKLGPLERRVVTQLRQCQGQAVSSKTLSSSLGASQGRIASAVFRLRRNASFRAVARIESSARGQAHDGYTLVLQRQ